MTAVPGHVRKRDYYAPQPLSNARALGQPALVYVVESDYGVKVGVSYADTFDARLASLRMASGLPMTVIRTYDYPDRSAAIKDEHEAHRRLADTRTFGEWFHCHPFEATATVEAIRRERAK